MAFTEFHYYSETLEIDVSVNVILPETRIMAQQEEAHPHIVAHHDHA